MEVKVILKRVITKVWVQKGEWYMYNFTRPYENEISKTYKRDVDSKEEK